MQAFSTLGCQIFTILQAIKQTVLLCEMRVLTNYCLDAYIMGSISSNLSAQHEAQSVEVHQHNKLVNFFSADDLTVFLNFWELYA